MSRLNAADVCEELNTLSDTDVVRRVAIVLREALTKDPLFFTEHWPEVGQIITLVARRELPVAESMLDWLEDAAKEAPLAQSSPYLREELPVQVNALRYEVQAQIARKSFGGASHEEVRSCLVIMSLQSRQPTGGEAGEFIRVLASYDFEHAFLLAQEWRSLSAPPAELIEAGWQRVPDSLFDLLKQSGPVPTAAILCWIEILLQHPQELARLIPLLELLRHCSVAVLDNVLDFVEALSEPDRAAILKALAPVTGRSLPRGQGKAAEIEAVRILLRFWKIESEHTRRETLKSLLHCLPGNAIRRLHRMFRAEGKPPHSISEARIRRLFDREYKNMEKVLELNIITSGCRLHWRYFKRSIRLIESISDKELKKTLSRKYQRIYLEVQRKYKGALIAALEADTKESIPIVTWRGGVFDGRGM